MISRINTNANLAKYKGLNEPSDFVAFNGTGGTKKNISDTFISSTKKAKDGDVLSKYLWSPTAVMLSTVPILAYEIGTLSKLHKFKKAGNKEAIRALGASFSKKFPLILAAGITALAGLQFLFRQNGDKRYKEAKQYFEEINTTEAEFSDETFKSSKIAASYNFLSGKISVGQNVLDDVYMNSKTKKLIKHELEHARQAETIARMDDGIEKLNYATMKNIASAYSTGLYKHMMDTMYDEIQNDKTGKYDNAVLKMSDMELDFKKFVTAIYLINNKNAQYKDIPMLVDNKHYQAVRDKMGKLTEEENKKAEEYYQAKLEYPKVTLLNIVYPFSEYYENTLEKEAFKQNPGMIGFIRKICGRE